MYHYSLINAELCFIITFDYIIYITIKQILSFGMTLFSVRRAKI
jgi:hypothetical protein